MNCAFKKQACIHSTQDFGMTHASLIPCPIKAIVSLETAFGRYRPLPRHRSLLHLQPHLPAERQRQRRMFGWQNQKGYFRKKEQHELITSEFYWMLLPKVMQLRFFYRLTLVPWSWMDLDRFANMLKARASSDIKRPILVFVEPQSNKPLPSLHEGAQRELDSIVWLPPSPQSKFNLPM